MDRIVHSKSELRRQMRELRRSVGSTMQQTHAHTIAQSLSQTHYFQQAQHIALYQPFDGEIPTDDIAQLMWQQGKLSYLPIVTPIQSQLCFVPYTQHSQLEKNKFGILEPTYSLENIIDVHQLELVITPLVAFDSSGNRLGMGAGFYDKTFAFLREDFCAQPKLIGLAYDFQRQSTLPQHTWDVPLTMVITEKNIYPFEE